MNPIFAIAALLAAITACSDVPDSPTWTEDVRPILVANCTRCHSPPQIGGSPNDFRLDIYEEALAEQPHPTDPDDTLGDFTTGGAKSHSQRISIRTSAGEMPPRFGLSDDQIDTLVLWDEMGAPRGEPRPDNAVPAMELTGDLVEQDDRVAIHYQIDDDDFDLVTSIICATDDPDFDPVAPLTCTRLGNPLGAGLPIFVTDGAVSGFGRVTWNTREFAAGNYRLIAELDDGQERVAVELGTVEVQP